MAIGIINQLEVVQVDQDSGQGIIASLGTDDFVIYHSGQVVAVVQSGQFIRNHQYLQLVGLPLPCKRKRSGQ